MNRECNFCSQPGASYVCPKCGLFYCSLNCYRHRNHLECTEHFYKDLVLQELSLNTNTQLKEETMKLLERMNLEDESLDFQSLLDDVDCAGKSSSILGQLTDEYGLPVEERAKFDKLVENGAIFNLLPAHFWDPWYVKVSQNLMLKTEDDKSGPDNEYDEVEKESEHNLYDEIDENDYDDIPSYPTDLPKLAEIMRQEPSPLIKCALIQTIFSYCAICRYFVGSHLSSPLEPYNLMVELSALDSTKISYPTTGQCLQFVSRHLIEQVQMPLCFVEKLYTDTSLIIKTGNRLVLRCLVDIVKLFKGAKKKRHPKSDEISRIIRKVKFYMSWCVEHESLYQSDLPSVHFEALSLKELINENQEIKNRGEISISKNADETNRKLIEIVE